MRKKHIEIYRVVGIFIFTILMFTVGVFSSVNVSAQTYSGIEAQGGWSGGDGWRRHSNEFENKINNLDKNKVMDLPVPILFGINPLNLTRNFGDIRSGGRMHEGLDIMAPMDAPIVTPTDAVVLRVGEGESAGKYVYTANPGGETFAYMHLNEIANIREGDEIKKGTLIGYVGNTGNAIGGAPHLHFEIRDTTGFLDPFSRLTRIFPIADKIEYLKTILNNSTDQIKLTENIVTLYRKELVLAQTMNIALPDSINTSLGNKMIVEISSTKRTLKIGLVGEDVKLLQQALGISADGSFGPKTKAAVVAFQISKNLTPDGVFGPKSRLALVGSGATTFPIGCTSSVGYSIITGVKCNTVL